MKSFIISSIKARPYDTTSGLANNFPMVEAFDERRDFILSNNVKAIAVLLDMRVSGDERQGAERFTAVLVDTTLDRAVAKERFTVRVNPWDSAIKARVDIPVTCDMIDPGHTHEVWIMRGCRDCALLFEEKHQWFPACWREVNFFRLKQLPPRMYETCGAWFEDNYDRLRNPYINWHGEVKAVFQLKAKNGIEGRRPEFFLRVVESNGNERFEQCRYRTTHDDKERLQPVFDVEADINLNFLCEGVVYAELQQFGIALAGIVFNPKLRDDEGMLKDEEVEAIRDYRPDEGERILAERYDDEEESHDAGDDDESFEAALAARMDDEEPCPATLPAKRLDDMVGLSNVKAHLDTFTQTMLFARIRQRAGLPFPQMPKHSLFLGSPGTGKTTVAKIMGEMLRDIGVLSRGHVVVRERATLIGSHYGDEETNTLKALEEAQGGILFIDEAYQLHQTGDGKDPGHFVLDSLMTALADDSNRDWMLILAGYTKPMLRMLEQNPGLSSRLPEVNHYHFEDYTPSELMEIARRYLASQQFELTPEADEAMLRLLTSDYANKGDDFGNARHVLNIIQTQLLTAMSRRVLAYGAQASATLLTTIEKDDVPEPSPLIRLPGKRVIGFSA